MNKEELIKEIEKYKKYCIIKTHRLKIDSFEKEIEQLKSDLYKKQKEYNKMKDTNYYSREKFKELEEKVISCTIFNKVFNFIKYSKLKKKYDNEKKEINNLTLIEERTANEIKNIESKIEQKKSSINDLCGFELTQSLYSNYKDESFEHKFYQTDLYELVEKLEKQLELLEKK